MRFLCDPTDDLVIVCTCPDELFEFTGIDSGEIEEYPVERTVVMIGSGATREFSPAFIYRPRGNNTVWSERSPSAPRSNSRQIRSECY